MKNKKIINIILNCIIVLSVVYAFTLKIINDKYDKLYNKSDSGYVLRMGEIEDFGRFADVFNEKMNKPIKIDDIALKTDIAKLNDGINNMSDEILGPSYIRWPMAPLFYKNFELSLDVTKYNYNDGSYVGIPFYEKVILDYKGEKKDITKKLIISDTEVVDLENDYKFSDLIRIFPYKDDIYMYAPISTKVNLKKNITAYEDYSNNNYYGYSFSNGSLKYALINLTSNEKTKVITIDEKTKKADIKENKYVKKMHKAGVNVFNCFEVKDNIQVVFNNIDDIKNVKVKEKIIKNLKKAYSDIPKDKPIVVSIKKKDFNKFVDIISGGK